MNQKNKVFNKIADEIKKFQKQETTKPKIIIILGQTATGKSDIAVEIAKEFNGEIISADSRQVYRGLDIGSGKITAEEMQGIPHFLLDVADPKIIYTVVDFQREAYKAIEDILSRGKLPIIAGGSAFYIQSIVDGLVFPKVKENKELRAKLNKLSLEELQDKLQKLDPSRFSEIDQKNKVRLVRAVEIAILNDSNSSDENNTSVAKIPKLKKEPRYESLQIGLKWPKEILDQKIHDRLITRVESGMIEEVERLNSESVSRNRLESFGLEYRYISYYLRGELSKEEMLEQLENKIRQFSKRQMTWWKKDMKINWFSLEKY